MKTKILDAAFMFFKQSQTNQPEMRYPHQSHQEPTNEQ